MRKKNLWKSRSGKNGLFVGCVLLFLTLLFTGCEQKKDEDQVTETLPAVIEPVPTPVPEQDEKEKEDKDEEEDKTWSYSYPEVDMVFDFAEFPENDFPRGQWTIALLTNKYGMPTEISAYYFPMYRLVRVDFIHDDIRVIFCAEYVERFSFYDEILAREDREFTEDENFFELNESDKNLELTVMNIWLFNNNARYPRNIRIGESTKQDVLNAYPPGTAYLYKSWGEDYYWDELIYFYNFRDENDELPDSIWGDATYFFDESEMLYRVSVSWFPGD